MFAALKPHAAILSLLLIVGACGAAYKLAVLGTIISSDYEQYVATGELLTGHDAELSPQRLLKPLAPLLLAGMASAMNYDTATLLQALLFYAAFIVAMYFLAFEFFRDRFGAAIITVLAAISYPVLKYGIELNTETGALFMYVLSLLITLKFLRAPSARLVLINALVITVAFLWKEYIVVAGLAFGLALLFHSALSARTKALYISMCAALFLVVHVPWQLYVYLTYDYSYFSWYAHNVTSAVEQREFTLFNIAKSTAALIGLAWIAVPFGLRRLRELPDADRRFLQFSASPTFIAYFWGYVSSRLLYVMAPPFLLIAYLGMRSWERRYQIALVAVTLAANLVWLTVSNRFTASY